MNALYVKEKLKKFLIEDTGYSDLTTRSIFPKEARGAAQIIAKEKGILSGVSLIKTLYTLLDDEVTVKSNKIDGQEIFAGEQIALIKGPIHAILTGERTLLNLMQRMSGIATATKAAVETLDNDGIRICDTRKTAPGLALFDTYAVRCGGGFNHRLGLYDGVMIKDNHIAFSGSIEAAVTKVRQQLGHMVKIEVEVESESQVKEAVKAKADVIMLDNCTAEKINKLSKHIPDTIITEASGGINMQNLSTYRDTQVDYISLGFLTHSVKALDMSLII